MKWFRSKAMWGAVLLGVGSVVRIIKPEWGPAIDAVIGVGAGLGIWGVRAKQERDAAALADAVKKAVEDAKNGR